MLDNSPLLLMTTPFDEPFLGSFKSLLGSRKAWVIDGNPNSAAEIEHFAKSKGMKYVISTNPGVLNKVVQSPKHQSIDNWNGSIYERNGITYLFLNAFRQFYSVPYGRFIAKRFVSKILDPTSWKKTPEFSWELATPETIGRWFELFSKCILIASDIETVSFENVDNKEYETAIKCIAYTGLWQDGNIHTIVLPILLAPQEEQMYWVTWMRKFNALQIPKIFQNGLYDNAHLLVYASPIWGYFFDTQSMFHSWYSELPKRLDFISAFNIHNVFYWKDMAQFGNIFEYNARDSWATLVSFLNLVEEMPDWAWKNYLIKFPKWVPCLACNLEGVKVDGNERERAIKHYITQLETIRARIGKWFGPDFNPNSSQQVTKLIQFYGSTDITNADEVALRKFALRHPLNARFAEEITNYKEAVTILSKYLKPENYSVTKKPANTKRKTYLLKSGRIFYQHNPDGTDTGRLSCSEGYGWTGTQIQNVTPIVKKMYIADEGWLLYERDKKQSEAYCLGYQAGEQNIIDVFNSGRDFHAVNVERFFGLKYDEIIGPNGEVLNVPIRDLSKRTNHGAGYNMQWLVLLNTMGEKNVDMAKKLLNLPIWYSRRQTCEHLLNSYDKAYPSIRNTKTGWYAYIISCVELTHKLISPLGWTRFCFGDPRNNKQDLNAYVAHAPQNLSVGIVNDDFCEMYWRFQVKYPKYFRLKAQIHDSIFFQIKIGHEYLLIEINAMKRPVLVKDMKGVERTMLIPDDMKSGLNWGSMKKVPKLAIAA